VYVDSTSSLTASSIGAVYHSAGDQKGLAVPKPTTIREMFHQLAAERQGRNGFPKARKAI